MGVAVTPSQLNDDNNSDRRSIDDQNNSPRRSITPSTPGDRLSIKVMQVVHAIPSIFPNIFYYSMVIKQIITNFLVRV